MSRYHRIKNKLFNNLFRLVGKNRAVNKNILLDPEVLRSQKLYEKWLRKEYWLLESEGVPLLLGIDPVNVLESDQETKQRLAELGDNLKYSVGQDSLAVKNSTDAMDKWLIGPMELYQWASINDITVPAAFTNLAQFILKSVNSS